ncbi:MAG: 3'(2'),5'-bisphosphate nucleotidase CysQ [marine bacterium B5-7]|nr:MAG: 3'(2'),5'-bisphosphate nucleotidase CysQ [marine bacterium B5-7]
MTPETLPTLDTLLVETHRIARLAGDAIMDVYNRAADMEVNAKSDGSPLTLADRRAHNIIVDQLRQLTPDIPVLSEESSSEAFESRREWTSFWLVDPLDGTKEFIRRNGEFTVNIALIKGSRPILGVVYTPAADITHLAFTGGGAFRIENGIQQSILTRPFNRNAVCMVASRSHAASTVASYREALEAEVEQVDSISMGSALKICLVAEGTADIYPRLGLTSEWDTGASDCVLKEAGGIMTDIHGDELVYNKPSILNPWFLAIGDQSHDWRRYLPKNVSEE